MSRNSHNSTSYLFWARFLKTRTVSRSKGVPAANTTACSLVVMKHLLQTNWCIITLYLNQHMRISRTTCPQHDAKILTSFYQLPSQCRDHETIDYAYFDVGITPKLLIGLSTMRRRDSDKVAEQHRRQLQSIKTFFDLISLWPTHAAQPTTRCCSVECVLQNWLRPTFFLVLSENTPTNMRRTCNGLTEAVGPSDDKTTGAEPTFGTRQRVSANVRYATATATR